MYVKSDSSRIEQVIMLGGLALYLVLATVIPAKQPARLMVWSFYEIASRLE